MEAGSVEKDKVTFQGDFSAARVSVTQTAPGHIRETASPGHGS